MQRGAKMIQIAVSRTHDDTAGVYLERTGSLHSSCFHAYWRDEDVSLSHAWFMEKLAHTNWIHNQQTGNHNEMSYTVMDLTGLGMDAVYLLHFLQAITDMDSAHYPETALTIYVINAPAIFPALWKLITAFLDPAIAAKVQVRGTDFVEPLLTVFGTLANFPVEWGGENKEIFPPLPDLKTATEQLEMQVVALGLKNLDINAGTAAEVECQVDGKADTTLQWFYRVTGYDVSVTVLFQPNGGDTVVVREAHRIASPTPSWGNYSVGAGSPGRLVLRFDNSYSYWRGKTVNYALKTRAFDPVRFDQLDTYTPLCWS
jgi:hypothetical protein